MQDPEICLVLNELNQKNLGPEQVIAALSLHKTVRKSETKYRKHLGKRFYNAINVRSKK